MAPGAKLKLLSNSEPTDEQPQQSNLPSQLTPLLGRAHEVQAARALLQRPEVRLATLTGPGGVGKTRLALELALDSSAALGGNVTFVPLASVTDGELVYSTIMQALALRESSNEPPLTRLRQYFARGAALLVLDNFEQILDAGPLVVDLLAACPDLKVLVTSRAPLRVRGEYELPVPPLALPGKNDLEDVAALAQYAAIALFVQRAAAVNPNFVLNSSNAATVAAICARLDGLPLAIELAAVRIKLLSPRALLERLDHRLALLVGGAGDLPLRQRTLRNTIDWSYSLLDDEEQRLFRRMAIFAGGCTLEAAAAVGNAHGDLATDMLDLIGSLLDKSLLRQLAPRQENEEPRVGMLETIREYAIEQLAAHDELADTRRQHSAYHLRLTEQFEPDLAGPRQGELMDRLEAEHDNLRLDLDWAIAAQDEETALRFCIALWWFWRARGYHSEGLRWLLAGLALPFTAVPDAVASFRRCAGLNAAGVLAYEQGDFEAATAFHEESLAMARRIERKGAISASLNNLGMIARARADYDQAWDYYMESLLIRRELGDTWSTGIALSNMGIIADMRGDYKQAQELFEESLVLRRGSGDERGVAMALSDLGAVMMHLGDYDSAQELQEQSLALHTRLANKWGQAATLTPMGEIALRRARYDEAQRYFITSLHYRLELNDREGLADSLQGLAIVAAAQNQHEHAARLFGAEDALREALGAPVTTPNRALRAQAVAAVRANLSSHVRDAAWAVGRSTPIERIMALVGLADAAPPLPEKPQIVLLPTVAAPPPASAPGHAAPYPAGLTEREVDVLRLVAQGLSNGEVGAKLSVSRLTVSAHLRSIYSKLNVTSRTAAARFAIEHKLT